MSPARTVNCLRCAGCCSLFAAKHAPGIVDLRAAIRMSRAGFSQQHLPAAHVYLARALYVVGDWDEALVHARAAQAIVSDDRLSWIRGRAEFGNRHRRGRARIVGRGRSVPRDRERRRERGERRRVARPGCTSRPIGDLPGQGRRGGCGRCAAAPDDRQARRSFSDGGGGVVADPRRGPHRLR